MADRDTEMRTGGNGGNTDQTNSRQGGTNETRRDQINSRQGGVYRPNRMGTQRQGGYVYGDYQRNAQGTKRRFDRDDDGAGFRNVRRRTGEVADLTDVECQKDDRGQIVSIVPRPGTGINPGSSFITPAPGHLGATMAVSDLTRPAGVENYMRSGELAAQSSTNGKILTLNIPMVESRLPFYIDRTRHTVGRPGDVWDLDEPEPAAVPWIPTAQPPQQEVQNTQRQVIFGQRDAPRAPGPMALGPLIGCEACRSTTHRTKICPMPSRDGDTVICPLHNVSAVYGRRAGVHVADAPRGLRTPGWIPCRVLLNRSLEVQFKYLAVERVGRPPIRVYTADLCFINIILRYSREHCHDEMPRQLHGRWPLLKGDCQQQNVIDLLRRWGEISVLDRPRSSLDLLSIQEVRRRYEASELPAQICTEPAPTANVDWHSEHGGDFILAGAADDDRPSTTGLRNIPPPANATGNQGAKMADAAQLGPDTGTGTASEDAIDWDSADYPSWLKNGGARKVSWDDSDLEGLDEFYLELKDMPDEFREQIQSLKLTDQLSPGMAVILSDLKSSRGCGDNVLEEALIEEKTSSDSVMVHNCNLVLEQIRTRRELEKKENILEDAEIA